MGINTPKEVAHDKKRSTSLDARALNSGAHRAHIADSDMGKVISILQDMYKEPVSAAIREYVANAVDSHRESGIHGIPVELTTEINDESALTNLVSITVQDFGKGLDKESTISCFTHYGASTKSDNGTIIGGFGLGAKSGLAFSSELNVKSVTETTSGQYEVTELVVYSGGCDIINHEITDKKMSTGVKISMIAKRSDYERERITRKMLEELFAGFNSGSVAFNGHVLKTVHDYEGIEKPFNVMDIPGVEGGTITIMPRYHYTNAEKNGEGAPNPHRREPVVPYNLDNNNAELGELYIAGIRFTDPVARKIIKAAYHYAAFRYIIELPSDVLKISVTRDNIQNTEAVEEISALIAEAAKNYTYDLAYYELLLAYGDDIKGQYNTLSRLHRGKRVHQTGRALAHVSFTEYVTENLDYFNSILPESYRPVLLTSDENGPLRYIYHMSRFKNAASITTIKKRLDEETATYAHANGQIRCLTTMATKSIYHGCAAYIHRHGNITEERVGAAYSDTYNVDHRPNNTIFFTYSDNDIESLKEPLGRPKTTPSDYNTIGTKIFMGLYRKTAAGTFPNGIETIAFVHEDDLTPFAKKIMGERIISLSSWVSKIEKEHSGKKTKVDIKTYRVKTIENSRAGQLTAEEIRDAYKKGTILGYATGASQESIAIGTRGYKAHLPTFGLIDENAASYNDAKLYKAIKTISPAVKQKISRVEKAQYLHINKGQEEKTLKDIGLPNMLSFHQIMANAVSEGIYELPGVGNIIKTLEANPAQFNLMKTLITERVGIPRYAGISGKNELTAENDAVKERLRALPLYKHAGDNVRQLEEAVASLKPIFNDILNISRAVRALNSGTTWNTNQSTAALENFLLDYLARVPSAKGTSTSKIVEIAMKTVGHERIDFVSLYQTALELDVNAKLEDK